MGKVYSALPNCVNHGVVRTDAILVDFNGPVVHLSHGLHLKVIAIAVVIALPVDVLLEILRHILRKVVGILQLWEGEKRERGGREEGERRERGGRAEGDKKRRGKRVTSQRPRSNPNPRL